LLAHGSVAPRRRKQLCEVCRRIHSRSFFLRPFAAIQFLVRIYYITLNTDDEARRISRALLEQQLAVCTNWFPITCAYRWEGKIVEEPETVLLVKTQAGYRQAIEEVVRQHISYTNLMAEIAPESVNESFANWLSAEVPLAAGLPAKDE
jgi:periplasmic divalent cation tolerance protein